MNIRSWIFCLGDRPEEEKKTNQKKAFVIVVDDERSIATAIKRPLESRAAERSHKIITAASALPGLGILEKHGEETTIELGDAEGHGVRIGDRHLRKRQLRQADHRGQGHGLSTALCKRIIEVACPERHDAIELGAILGRGEYGPEHHRRLLDAALEEPDSAGLADDVAIANEIIIQMHKETAKCLDQNHAVAAGSSAMKSSTR
jgi:hypothetical protein